MKKFANVQKQKLKKKSEVQKEDMHAKRKQMYKNKEKLMQNEASHDDNIIVYKEGMTVSELAKELNVNPSYITKIIKNDIRYIQEKEYRTQISKENRKIAKREWIRNKRQSENDKQLYEFVKQQHIEASKELSYSSEMSDLAYRKWNSSAYHRNSKGNLVIDRKLKVGSDVPKSINMNIKIPTQKYKKKYCYSI